MDPLNPDQPEVISFPAVADALAPGVYTEVFLYARVAYSGPEDNPRVHISVIEKPRGTSWLVYTPLCVALMGAIARATGEGLEAALEALVKEAILRSGHRFKCDQGEGNASE